MNIQSMREKIEELNAVFVDASEPKPTGVRGIDDVSKEELAPEDVKRLREILHPQGLRGIDDVKFNEAAEAVRKTSNNFTAFMQLIADKGLVITPSIGRFKSPITFTIQIAKETP